MAGVMLRIFKPHQNPHGLRNTCAHVQAEHHRPAKCGSYPQVTEVYLIDTETEPQRGEVTHSRLHSQEGQSSGQIQAVWPRASRTLNFGKNSNSYKRGKHNRERNLYEGSPTFNILPHFLFSFFFSCLWARGANGLCL